MTEAEKANIKDRLSNIGAKVGELALNYIENLEKENAKLKAQIESPCTGCQITESLEEELEETDYQVVNQDAEIRQLKKQIENKPKWHEIESHVTPKREISKKYMPKTGEKVLLKYYFYGDDELHYSDGFYNIYDFEFHIPNNVTGRAICVIAWCELF